MFGQHAWFIWGSYGALALAVALELWALRRRRQAARSLARQAQQTAQHLGSTKRFEEHA